MAAYQSGDRAAFAELLARHERRLWAFIRRFVANEATAEDLLQEVFLRVVKSAPEWQPAAKVSTWLYTIARNLCTDEARHAAVHKDESLGRAPLPAEASGRLPCIDDLAGAGQTAEKVAMDREIAVRVDSALGRLPVEQREVFLMREVMDMSFAEIAVATKASEPTVKSRMRYALEHLRVALGELAEPEDNLAMGRV